MTILLGNKSTHLYCDATLIGRATNQQIIYDLQECLVDAQVTDQGYGRPLRVVGF